MVLVVVIVCVISCCVNKNNLCVRLSYNVWSNDENSTTINSTLCLSPSCSSAVVDCYIWLCWCVRRNNHNGFVCWWMMMSISLLNLLSCPCPCPSVPPRIFTTLLFQAYTYIRVMLLIVLYDGVMLVRMNWYTGDRVTSIRDDVTISIVCRTRWIMCHPMGSYEW